LKNTKTFFFESKGNLDNIILKYKKAAMEKKGALLFCVCRGKVSEGIDFPN
jgi:Rad3-related DNA helicase